MTQRTGCKEQMTSRSSKKRYWERKRAGLCVNCGRAKAEGGVFCGACKARHYNCQADKYLRLKAEGRCRRCGEPVEGTVICRTCTVAYYTERGYQPRGDIYTRFEREDLSDALESRGPPPDELAAKALLRGRIEEVLSSLKRRDRIILIMRFGLYDGHVYTLEEVGKVFSRSRERIRQLECRAIRRLQHPQNAGPLKGIIEPF